MGKFERKKKKKEENKKGGQILASHLFETAVVNLLSIWLFASESAVVEKLVNLEGGLKFRVCRAQCMTAVVRFSQFVCFAFTSDGRNLPRQQCERRHRVQCRD